MESTSRDAQDSPSLRKARGAFFTPPAIARFVANWAIRDVTDRVLEPSMGDAEFLVHAVERLQVLGQARPVVYGSELHAWSAERGQQRVSESGGTANVEVGDFFKRQDSDTFDAVIGNPPYIRFQDFTGEQRATARAAALGGGVALSGLASAWAAFTVQAAVKLSLGGRLGFVLPAELLSSNYAAPVRKFIFDRFAEVELIMFEERVFDEADTETVLLLADGFGRSSTSTARIRQVQNVAALSELPPATQWTPIDPSGKWSGAVVSAEASKALVDAVSAEDFVALQSWGDTTLGAVTGKNTYFAMSPEQERTLSLQAGETVLISPPGSAHLRGIELSASTLEELGRIGKATRLFHPDGDHSPGAGAYISHGESAGIDKAYKCRVRREWWRVPLLDPPDLFLTYMNADTVRLVTNSARAHHLNSVHGVYLKDDNRARGMELLPLASLNSLTMLSAEIGGRAYGGGILKMEPGEADRWLVPSPRTIDAAAERLREIRPHIRGRLSGSTLNDAVRLVDQALLIGAMGFSTDDVAIVRDARDELARRRGARGRRVGP